MTKSVGKDGRDFIPARLRSANFGKWQVRPFGICVKFTSDSFNEMQFIMISNYEDANDKLQSDRSGLYEFVFQSRSSLQWTWRRQTTT